VEVSPERKALFDLFRANFQKWNRRRTYEAGMVKYVQCAEAAMDGKIYQKLDDGEYEVGVACNTNIVRPCPRFILRTTKTQFRSRGDFTLCIRASYEVREVQLQDGFTTTVAVWTEDATGAQLRVTSGVPESVEPSRPATSPSTPPAPEQPAPPNVPPGPSFHVQIGAYQNEEEAQMTAHHRDGRVVAADIPGKGRWYRVWVDKYASREEAEAKRAEMERDFGDKYVVGEDEDGR